MTTSVLQAPGFQRRKVGDRIFDVSPTDAIESRRKMLARAAGEDLLIARMRMPFPGFTRIGRSADAYVHHPEVWQYDLRAQGSGRDLLRVTLAKRPIAIDVECAERPRGAFATGGMTS